MLLNTSAFLLYKHAFTNFVSTKHFVRKQQNNSEAQITWNFIKLSKSVSSVCLLPKKITLHRDERKHVSSVCNNTACALNMENEKVKYSLFPAEKGFCLDIFQCVTIVIKTRHREIYTIQLIKSILKYYQGIKIIVVDEIINSLDEKQYKAEQLAFPWQKVVDLSDSIIYFQTRPGISFGRNLGLQMTTTKYALFADDDFIFTNQTNILKLLHVLETTDASIVGGTLQPDNFFNGILKAVRVSLVSEHKCVITHAFAS